MYKVHTPLGSPYAVSIYSNNMASLISLFSLTLFQASLNRGPERGPRENADQDAYPRIPVNDLAALLELNDNLNRENRATARNRSPTENALPIPHGAPLGSHLMGTSEAPRGSLDNLHFPLDDRHIDWSEDNI